MLPASNRGSGQSLNFPDVCKTPAPPAPFVPIPYPDLGMNMQAAPFSPFVQVGFVPATNMSSQKVMTSGDEAGTMGGLVSGMIKGPGKTTMGNPLVMIGGQPAECLANPTSGNNMNAPAGAQIVPSVINVLYTYRGVTDANLLALHDVAEGEGQVRSASLGSGIVYLRVELFTKHTDREVFNALRSFDAIESVVIDLRDNPGGDTRSALRLAEAWLPAGSVLLRERDGDDVIARGGEVYPWSLVILIDETTASAAELFAGALQHHGRARIVGKQSYGKATAQQIVRWPDGKQRYTTVTEFCLPDGSAIEGVGITPNVVIA